MQHNRINTLFNFSYLTIYLRATGSGRTINSPNIIGKGWRKGVIFSHKVREKGVLGIVVSQRKGYSFGGSGQTWYLFSIRVHPLGPVQTAQLAS